MPRILTVSSISKVFKPLAQRLKTLGSLEVLVGIPSDSPSYPDGTPLPTVAMCNDQGIGVPERPFLGEAIKQRLPKYRQLLKDANRKILSGQDATKVLSLVGEEGRQDVVQQIDDTYDPPNSPRTIALKGSDHPLIDTGLMRSQINYQVRKAR